MGYLVGRLINNSHPNTSCKHSAVTHYSFRYVDIFSGICMLASHGCLGLGSTRQGHLLLSGFHNNWHIWSSFRKNSQFVGLYFTLTFGLVIIYWLWFIYLKYGICETEASKEVVFQYQYFITQVFCLFSSLMFLCLGRFFNFFCYCP